MKVCPKNTHLLQAYIETGSIYEEISLDNKVPFHIDLFETNIKADVFRMLGEQGQSALFAVKVIFHGIEYRKIYVCCGTAN